MKLYRVGSEIKLESLNKENLDSSEDNYRLSDCMDSVKVAEIKLKNDKFYYIPNRKKDMKTFDGNENFSWLVYKGQKYPLTKHKYKIKEGDVLKLGREWLIIKGIFIKKKEKMENNNNSLISFHSQINQTLNLNNAFQKDNDYAEQSMRNINKKNSFDSSENEIENEVIGEEVEKNKEGGKKIIKLHLSKERVDKKRKSNKMNMDNDKTNATLMNKKNENNKKSLSKKNCNKLKKNDKKTENKKLCRICYIEETDPIKNPLIRPCKCSGSMKYIHYECLLHWIKTKFSLEKSEYFENNYFSLYSNEDVECELCKQVLPDIIKHNNKTYSLIKIEQNLNLLNENNENKKDDKNEKNSENDENVDNENYIVFDNVPFDKQTHSYRYVVKFGKDKIMRIGRGLDMQLILNDLSVSRNHCKLTLSENGDILLEDSNSKFGTLVLIQAKAIEILKGQTLTVQAGRAYLNIEYKKNFSLFNCCAVEEVEKKKTYEKINYKNVSLEKFVVLLNESLTDENNSDNEEDVQQNNDENLNLDNDVKNINNIKIANKKMGKRNLKKNIANDETHDLVYKKGKDKTNNGSTLILKDGTTDLSVYSPNMPNSNNQIESIDKNNGNSINLVNVCNDNSSKKKNKSQEIEEEDSIYESKESNENKKSVNDSSIVES